MVGEPEQGFEPGEPPDVVTLAYTGEQPRPVVFDAMQRIATASDCVDLPPVSLPLNIDLRRIVVEVNSMRGASCTVMGANEKESQILVMHLCKECCLLRLPEEHD